MERTQRRARPAAIAALALALPVTLGALPAAAAPTRVVYDALGDSYAAGFGTAPPVDDCARSELAYPYVLDGRMQIHLDDFAACSGATVPDLLANQLDALDADTDLVTISIGGNDIGWGQVITACLVADEQQCAEAVAGTSFLIQNQLPSLLGTAYTAVRAAAPDAHVVITGYPRLFSPEHGDYVPDPDLPLVVSPTEQQMLNDGADLLNSVIAQTAQEHGFQFVDVRQRFEGKGVNAPNAWIGGIEDPEQFHPTARGQHAYGVSLRAAIRPSTLR